ncbi:hypothetical protein Ssi02_40270 [Sinosporangium siamense]|uniref:Uncharacterized protein n=1 Tax=Sinosporangium siamense TaxID=1367973 RepID=A0A919V843_9ACTN|nr:hypothetical protein Ssi02_40270 [Sinosporangium siamense]
MADARRFDRLTVVDVSDVWDNNTFPLFQCASAGTRWGRERRARAALRWMAELGASRRAWMVEQGASAGFALDSLLDPVETGRAFFRDSRGKVRPSRTALTGETVGALAGDYDLRGAEVRQIMVERVGTRLRASLILTAERCYAVPGDSASPAELRFSVEDLVAGRFDADDGTGAVLSCANGEISVRLGRRGLLLGGSGSVYIDDHSWHLSKAGRAADAIAPPFVRSDARPRPKRHALGESAQVAAGVVHWAMLSIRMVRFAQCVDHPLLRSLARTFAGAGTAVVAAGAAFGAGRRERRFRELVVHWAGRGGPGLAPWFAEALTTVREPVPGWVEELVGSFPPVADQEVEPAVTAGEVRLAKFTADATVFHMASPSAVEGDAAWDLHVVPGKADEGFHLDTTTWAPG